MYQGTNITSYIIYTLLVVVFKLQQGIVFDWIKNNRH